MKPHKTILLCLSFFTRLPLSKIAPPMDSIPLAEAVWAFPVAGLIVGALCAGAYEVCQMLGLAKGFCAMFTVAFQWWLTGALHEDGLADTADGFAGGYTKESRLRIMRDSSIGTFGALALIITTFMRVEALLLLSRTGTVIGMIIISAIVSRAMIAIGMYALPNARADGLAAWAGRPSRHQTLIAVALAAVMAAVALRWRGLELTLAALIACGIICLTSKRKIGGITGDVYGAIQQVAEVGMLVYATTVAHF